MVSLVSFSDVHTTLAAENNSALTSSSSFSSWNQANKNYQKRPDVLIKSLLAALKIRLSITHKHMSTLDTQLIQIVCCLLTKFWDMSNSIMLSISTISIQNTPKNKKLQQIRSKYQVKYVPTLVKFAGPGSKYKLINFE